jgi:hypothetical protein
MSNVKHFASEAEWYYITSNFIKNLGIVAALTRTT